MASREILIALDGGGSATRCAAFDPTGRLLAEADSGPSNHLAAARETVLGSLRDAIFGALERCGAHADDVSLVTSESDTELLETLRHYRSRIRHFEERD